MVSEPNKYQVAIVGGGPVGLFLACCLHHAEINCIVLEKRAEPISHSRSIGIHPVSLAKFAEIGLAEKFVSAGIKVRQGLAYSNAEYLGAVNFQTCPPPFSFILTLPQYKTECILRNNLRSRGKGILHLNSTVKDLHENNANVELKIGFGGREKKITADFVIGCDGKNSFVRQAAGIYFEGKTYKDTYIMGDFSDNTSLGNDAAIYLCNNGVIESFPLAKGMRRWVIKTNRYMHKVHRKDIELRMKLRIGRSLAGTKNTMLSSFGVQKRIASTMNKGRIILAGDAAHVVSPIGGQGMNLGWLEARDISECLSRIFYNKAAMTDILAGYSKKRLKITRKVIRRAEFNMFMGRKSKAIFFKKHLLKMALHTPVSSLLARLFTMHGLHYYPV